MPRHKAPLTTLATDQSQFNADPFQKLHNLAIREAGMVEPLPGRSAVVSNYGASGYEGRRMWPLKDQATAYELALARSTASATYESFVIASASSSSPTIASNTLLGEPCGLTETRERPFYAGPRGVIVFESDASTVRMLGMLPPTWLGVVGIHTTAAQAVPASSRIAYRATLHRKHADDYEITSAPSYAMWYQSGGSTTDFTVRVGWTTVGAVSDVRVRAGDVIRLWRARAVTTGTSTNDRYLLVMEQAITSTDVSNRYADIRDTTPDAALASAEELYTNPGIQGALQANWQLGPSGDAAVYNGHAFYAERSIPAFKQIRVASGFGYVLGTTARRTYGVGLRELTSVGVTSGSPTVTGLDATDLIGLVAGQEVTSTNLGSFPAGTTVVSVNSGAGTATMSANSAVTNAAEGIRLVDLLTINGSSLRCYNLTTLIYDAWAENLAIIITTGEVVCGDGLNTSLTPVTVTDPDNVDIRIDMIAPYGVAADDLEINATNGANYSPALPDPDDDPVNGSIDERLNRVKWSKLDQPDHVPAVNELVVGKGEVIRLLSTGDRLLAFCSDGTYAITGNESAWSVDRVDKDLIIASQSAADEMGGDAYVYANDRGLLRIGRDGSIVGLSKGAVQRDMNSKIATAIGTDDDGLYEAHVVCDELHSEVGVFFNWRSNFE